MGDRTSVWIRIGGEVKDLDALVEALENEGMTADWRNNSTERMIEAMRASDEDGAEFTAEEVNYGNCDDLEAELKKQGLNYEFHWYTGCEYGEGGHIYTPDEGWREYSGEAGDCTITAIEIRARKLTSIEDLLAHLDSVNKFRPGKLVIPHPLIQAVLKARKDAEEED